MSACPAYYYAFFSMLRPSDWVSCPTPRAVAHPDRTTATRQQSTMPVRLRFVLRFISVLRRGGPTQSRPVARLILRVRLRRYASEQGWVTASCVRGLSLRDVIDRPSRRPQGPERSS